MCSSQSPVWRELWTTAPFTLTQGTANSSFNFTTSKVQLWQPCLHRYQRSETGGPPICSVGLVRSHHFGYEDCESLQAIFSKEACPNLMAGPTEYGDHGNQHCSSLMTLPSNCCSPPLLPLASSGRWLHTFHRTWRRSACLQQGTGSASELTLRTREVPLPCPAHLVVDK